MNSTAMNTNVMNGTAMTSASGARTETDAAIGLLGPLSVRRAVPSDREALTRMFARSTRQTRYDRFHGHVNAIPERYLTEALSGSPFHYALVALAVGATADRDGADRGGADRATADPHGPVCSGAGHVGPVGLDSADDVIVALASCRAITEGVAELGIFVEDRWQRHGTGARLLWELAGHADRAGFRVLKAQILSEQAWIITLLERYGTCHAARGGFGTLDVTLRLGSSQPSGPVLPPCGISPKAPFAATSRRLSR